jgi:putative transposase
MSKPKIKFKIYNNAIIDEQIIERHKFSVKFNNIVRNYLKSICDNKILPSTFCLFWKDNNCVPFWKPSLNIVSAKLFSPINGNIKVDDITKNKFNKNKWFDSEFHKEVYMDARINNIRIPIKEQQTGQISKVVKIRLYCNPKQKQVLKRFFGVYRYFYNRTISYAKNINKTTNKSYYYIEPKDENTKKQVDLPKSYYEWFALKKLLYKNKPKWLEDIGFDSHSCKQAIKEALIGIKTNLKKKSKFTMRMKAKKNLVNTIKIEKQTISNKYKSIFTGYKLDGKYIFRDLKMSDDITKYNYGDSTISYHRILDAFTLNLTYSVPIKENKETKICSIDPGVNNFMTCFSEDSACKLGINCDKKIGKVCKEVDIIQSRIDKGFYYNGDEKKTVNANRKRNLRKALHRKIQYIKDLRNELHNQVINYLVSNFGKIIITPFKTQEMVQKLSSKVARKMNTLSHYMFRTKLGNKCEELNKTLEIKQEYYTSQTCTICGNIKSDLGYAKIYHCHKCGMTMERDYNGARNIMLRNNY